MLDCQDGGADHFLYDDIGLLRSAFHIFYLTCSSTDVFTGDLTLLARDNRLVMSVIS